MSCDHNTIEKITLNSEYALVYCGTNFHDAIFSTRDVESAHTMEVFSTAQGLFDKAFSLGLRCKTKHLLKAMEHGAVLPQEVMDELLGYIWGENPLYIKRMEALGFSQP